MHPGRLRAEPTPYEAMLIATTLENPASLEDLLQRIHHSAQERSQLQAQLSLHPWSAHETAVCLRTLGNELEQLWAEVRRRRAALRTQLECRLGIDPTSGEDHPAEQNLQETTSQPGAHSLKRRRVPLLQAS
jgi:hypothetical protein